MTENDQKKKGFFSSGLSALKDAAEKAAPIAQKAFDDAKQYAKDTAIPSMQKAASDAKQFTEEKVAPAVSSAATAAGKKIEEGTTAAKSLASKTKNQVSTALDVNGDGTVDIQDVIILGLKTPGIKINRENFLRKEFSKNYSKETIDKAIKETPANAGIPAEDISKMVDEVIKFERACVSGISTALGVPGGPAAVAAATADIGQYYGYMLRAAQKMMYLYGFPQIIDDENESVIDTETMNILILCLGVMFGVQGANAAIKAMAKGLSKGISKKIMTTALTKTTWYPILKKICKWFAMNMTKEALSKIAEKSVPVVGGVVGGAITYVTFKPCCDRLKESLKDTYLSNPHHVESDEEKAYVIDVDVEGSDNTDASDEDLAIQ